jgi:hypothetical protein
MSTCKKVITNGYDEEEIEITVHYDYEPEEPAGYDYPGAAEALRIYDVEPTDGRSLSLLPDYQELLEEEILEQIHYDIEFERDWVTCYDDYDF